MESMDPMNTLWFLVLGLVAGWLAGRIMKGKGFGLTPGGNVVTGPEMNHNRVSLRFELLGVILPQLLQADSHTSHGEKSVGLLAVAAFVLSRQAVLVLVIVIGFWGQFNRGQIA